MVHDIRILSLALPGDMALIARRIDDTAYMTAGGTLLIDANELANRKRNAEYSAKQRVKGGYLYSWGDTVQPGGYLQAAEWQLNVRRVVSVSGEFVVCDPDPAVRARASAQLEAELRETLGEAYEASVAEDHLQHRFKPKKKRSLGGLLGAVAALVVSFYTFGAAAGAFATLADGAASTWAVGGLANTVTASSVSSMATSATGQVVATGRVDLRQVGRAAATSALTAFALNMPLGQGGQSLNQLAAIDASPTGTTRAHFSPEALPGNASATLVRATVSAGIQSAIERTSFAEALRHQLADSLAAVGANAIGQAWGDGRSPLLQTAAHTTLGCAAAAARGLDCASGALGGALSTRLNPWLDDWIGGDDGSGWGATTQGAQVNRQAGLTSLTMLGSGLAAYAIGRDPLAAAEAAKNETLNNWLHPREQTLKQQAARACMSGQDTACQIQRMLLTLDEQRESTPSAKFTQSFLNTLATAGSGAFLLPIEIVQAVAEGRSLDALAGALRSIVNLPTRLATGLASSDPTIQGAAVAESLIIVAGATALAKNVVKTTPVDPLNATAKIENRFYRDGAAVDHDRAFDFQPGRVLAAEEANARTVAFGNNALNPQMPYARGTTVTERLAQPGERLYVIEYQRQAAPGTWATSKQYASLELARQELALLPEFKNSADLVVREYTVVKPIPVREGTVGSLTSAVNGKTYVGGGRQVEFMFDVRQDWARYLRRSEPSGMTIR